MENRYDWLPRAGDIETESGTETIYLSPKPVPTGVQPFSARQLHHYADDVILDFSISRGNFEFMTRAGIGAVMFLLIFIFFTRGFGSWIRRSIAVCGFMEALAALYLCVFFFAIRQVSNQPPIHFNRQRREVFFVPKKGITPRWRSHPRHARKVVASDACGSPAVDKQPPAEWQAASSGFCFKIA
ncbi:hypothetical protein ACIOYV_01100 [Pseudomonas sp. NPDC087342]|uniref:hypothetical protein n=1 Tax=Pseudomonas sp. NPDC087342 TaxID=3364437 RepID=UPI0037F5EF9B